ncbi:MAG: PKD domain-containing protein [Bacteroidota bacterium]
MKKIYFTLPALMFFSIQAIPQADTSAACRAGFEWKVNDMIMMFAPGMAVNFYDRSEGEIASWFWDFGDGTTSDEPNPVHGFDFMGGVFNVCLTITTADSCANSYCAPVYIGNSDTTVMPGCQALFTYNVMESYPEQFAFQDLSMGTNPTGWFWDFGDGTFSNEQNPVHVFGKRSDSLDPAGYFGPPVSDHYKVCLTVVNEDNCKSSYCDYVYMGGVTDTIFPQPCPYFISLTTSNILGGNYCNGTALASLVDAEGNPVEAVDFYWSNGETGPAASGLCLNIPYYVSITGMDGCQLVGSFAIIDYSQPMNPVGFWTIYGFRSCYDLNYNPPDSGYVCNWTFSDGTILTGDNVNYAFTGNTFNSVTLNVLDASGNVVYSEEIALQSSTRIPETKGSSLKLYPNPAADEIHIAPGETLHRNVQVDIYNSLGQKLISEDFTEASGLSEISVSVTTLQRGIYYARVLGIGNSAVTLGFVK